MNSDIFSQIVLSELLSLNINELPHTFEYSIPEDAFDNIKNTQNLHDIDLFFAARKCDLSITISLSDSSLAKKFRKVNCFLFNVSYTIEDGFDFHKLTPQNGSPNFIQWFNDTFGYIPQENGQLNPYNWISSGSFYLVLGQGYYDFCK